MKTVANQPSSPIEHEATWNGLTKREYFAAASLQGVLANPSSAGSDHNSIASFAVKSADALIEALNKNN